MSQDIYIVCNFPGSAGNAISGSIYRNHLELGLPINRDDFVYATDLPEAMTPEWFYENWSLNSENTGTQVCNIFHLPDYNNIKSKYPDAKIIVLTHTLDECHAIAMSTYASYFIGGWDSGLSQASFKNLLLAHPLFFPDPDVSIHDLTLHQRRTFIFILANQAVLAGFHNLTVPTDDPTIIEIKHSELIYGPVTFKEKLKNILGVTELTTTVLADYTGFLSSYHEQVYDRYKYQYEST